MVPFHTFGVRFPAPLSLTVISIELSYTLAIVGSIGVVETAIVKNNNH